MNREFATWWRAACAYGLLAIVFAMTVALPIATFWRDEPLRVGAVGAVNLFVGQAVLAAFLLAWYALQERTGWREFLHLPQGRWPQRIADGAGVGVRGWLLTMAVMAALGLITHAAGVTPHAGFADLMVWMAERPLALRVALIVSAMTVEEAFFRAFLQPRIGMVAATTWFALSHVNYGSPTMGGGVFVIGWIFGRTFRRTGDLAICAAAHGTFDAIQLLIVLPAIASRL